MCQNRAVLSKLISNVTSSGKIRANGKLKFANLCDFRAPLCAFDLHSSEVVYSVDRYFVSDV